MKDQIEFEMLLEEVLREAVHAEPVEGLEQRVMRQIDMAEVSSVMVAGASEGDLRVSSGTALFETSPQEQGVFRSLWSGLRELLFPAKLPPLVLESHPVAVVDRMAGSNSYPSTGYAVAAHALVIFLIGFVVNAQIRKVPPTVTSVTTVADLPPVPTPPKTDLIGGGGGQKGVMPVTRGRLPKLVQEQLIAPKIPQVQTSVITLDQVVVVQKDLKMADNLMPDLGVPNSPLAGVSMGNGRGMGLGSGDGDGIGPGTGGNTGGYLHHVGGGVSEPQILYQPEPEFSEEARKAKVSGSVLVYLWVDEHGNPTHVRVVRGIGMGLDEKALEAVRHYKFRPAMENGKPVTVEMYVDAVFDIR